MSTATIDLTDDQESGLEQLAAATGKPAGELIHIAIQRLLLVARERTGSHSEEIPRDPPELPFWGIWGHLKGLPEDFQDWRAAEDQARFNRLYPELT